jgi:hypothetical protein
LPNGEEEHTKDQIINEHNTSPIKQGLYDRKKEFSNYLSRQFTNHTLRNSRSVDKPRKRRRKKKSRPSSRYKNSREFKPLGQPHHYHQNSLYNYSSSRKKSKQNHDHKKFLSITQSNYDLFRQNSSLMVGMENSSEINASQNVEYMYKVNRGSREQLSLDNSIDREQRISLSNSYTKHSAANYRSKGKMYGRMRSS